MSRSCADPTPVLLDPETWDVPFRLSVDDLYLQAGTDRRAGLEPANEPEDDR